MDAVIVLETETKYNELMLQVLGWRKQANPTDQYPEQAHILEQVTSLRRTLNLDSKNYLVDHSQQDWPGGQETAGQLRRSEGRQAREREGPEWTHSRRPSGVLRWGLSCSPQQQVGRCFNIQYYHTSWIASFTSSNLHMAWTPSTRYRDGIQWHDEPCFFRSKIICEDSELQMTRWTTITKAKAWYHREYDVLCVF